MILPPISECGEIAMPDLTSHSAGGVKVSSVI